MVKMKNNVLIVDDDNDFAESLVDLLTHKGYETLVALSVQDALKKISEFPADIALLDIRLGRDSGISLIKQFQKVRPGILCVMITAYAAIDSAIDALKQGAYDYLRKPLAADDLIATVERCFEVIRLRDEKEAVLEMLAKSEERYRTLVETMNEGLVIHDHNGIISYVNNRFCEMLDHTRKEILDRDIREFLDSKNRDLFCENSKNRNTDHPISYELEWLKRNGSSIPTVTSPCILADGEGNFRGCFEVVTDITQQKIGEEFIKAQRDLGLALSEFVEIKEAFRLVLDVALRISGMDNGSIFLVDKSTGAVDLVHYEGVTSDFAKKRTHLPPDSDYCKQLKSKKPVYFTFKTVGVQVNEQTRREGLKSYCVIPVLYEDQVIATLNVGSHYLEEIPLSIRPVLEAVASQIGGVLVRVDAEEKLIKERTTLDNIISLNPYAIVVFDSQGKFVRANRSFIELFGIMPNRDNTMFEDVFLSMEIFAQKISKVRMGEIARISEVWFNPRDISPGYTNKRICLSATFFPTFASHGGVENIILMLEDITSFKMAQEAVQETEQRFRAVVESAQDCIFIKDKSLRYVFANQHMERSMYFKAEEILGHTASELFDSEIAKELEEQDRRVLAGETVEFEQNNSDKGGDLSFHVVKAPMKNQLGENIGICGIARDITERKKFEARLLNYQAQLQALAIQLSITEEKERRRFAVDLHDRIGQALAFSKIKLGLLNEELSNENLDKQHFSEQIVEVRNLIEETIEETRTMTFELSPPILYELGLESAVDWLAEDFRDKQGLNVEVRKEKTLKQIDDNLKGLLFQAIRELLTNVAKHANAKNVQVSLKRVDGSICITVKDDGSGFEPASVQEPSSSHGGFGLFNIRERLNHFGGKVEIDAKPGKGTRVILKVPITSH
jgi:PAS domain S-box-containing protein